MWRYVSLISIANTRKIAQIILLPLVTPNQMTSVKPEDSNNDIPRYKLLHSAWRQRSVPLSTVWRHICVQDLFRVGSGAARFEGSVCQRNYRRDWWSVLRNFPQQWTACRVGQFRIWPAWSPGHGGLCRCAVFPNGIDGPWAHISFYGAVYFLLPAVKTRERKCDIPH